MRWTGTAHATLRSDLQHGTESYVVSYHDLAVTRGARAMLWNFRIELVRPPIGNQVASVDGAMTIDSMQLALHQDEPFIISPDGHPRSGQVSALDRRGARLQVEALRRRYAYRFFSAGNRNDAPDAVSESKPYGAQ